MSTVTVTRNGGGEVTFRAPAGVDETQSDPTHTARIRELLVAELSRRWQAAMGAIESRVNQSLASNPSLHTEKRLRSLRETLRGTVNEYVLEPTPTEAVKRGNHWTARYISDAFDQGMTLIRGLLQDIDVPTTSARHAVEPSSTHVTRIEREQRVELYQALLDVRVAFVEAAVEQARRVIEDRNDGEAQPSDAAVPLPVPDTIAAAALNRASAVGLPRSKAAAITSIVGAVNAYALAAYDDAGITHVGASPEGQSDRQSTGSGRLGASVGEVSPDSAREGTPPSRQVGASSGYGMWKTANDEAVCELCRPLHGRVYLLADIRQGDAPRPPLHPNCRCFILPLRKT